MRELERALIGDSAAMPASRILEGLGAELADQRIAGAPHTIYEELSHVSFWQETMLDWISGVERVYPESSEDAFPKPAEVVCESWEELKQRFFEGLDKAAATARDHVRFEELVRCTSPAGAPVRTMTVREQLEGLATHNSYHFGRVVLLRQLLGVWPPVSGGSTW